MQAPTNEPYIDRGEPLPQSYAENTIVAMVRDPLHLYVYWDVEPGSVGSDEGLVVRVHYLSEGRSHDVEPPAFTDNWYLEVTPNRTYRAELLKRSRDGCLVSLAVSAEVSTPVVHAGEFGAGIAAEITTAQRRPLKRKAGAVEAPARLAHMPYTSPPVPVSSPAETVLRPEYASGRGGGLS